MRDRTGTRVDAASLHQIASPTHLHGLTRALFVSTHAADATGALYRVYPGGWSVWRENGAASGGYELTYSSSRRPGGDEVDGYLEGPDDGDGDGGGNPFDGLGAFIKGFQAM